MNKRLAAKIAKAIMANEAVLNDDYIYNKGCQLTSKEQNLVHSKMAEWGNKELDKLGIESTGDINILINSVLARNGAS